MAIKVGLSGTHGSGKTSAAFYLSAELSRIASGVDVLTELARKTGWPVNEQGDDFTQLWLIASQIVREIEEARRPGTRYLICDRTVMDNYVYCQYHSGSDEVLFSLAQRWMQTYDYMIYVIPDMPLEEDGFRSTDIIFQTEIKEIFDDILDDLTIEPLRIKSSNLFQVETIEDIARKIIDGDEL